MTRLLVYFFCAIGISFCCSLLEATLLSSRLSALENQRSAGNRGAGMLADLKRRRVDEAISAILVVSEIVPKTLGTVYWRILSGIAGLTLALMMKLMAPVLMVSSVLTRTVTCRLPLDTSVDDLLKNAEAEPFSRIPIFDREPENVVGYVLVRDVLRAAAAGCDRVRKLATWMRQISHVPEIIGTALSQFLERRASIAIVTDEHGGLAKV